MYTNFKENVMSQREKLFEKLKSGPKSATISDILTIMKSFGFEVKESSHGYIFVHPKLTNITMPHVAKPHGRENKVLITYVKECIKAIELLGEEGRDERLKRI
jgi:hypothetical protein